MTNKRKIILINPHFQLRFLFANIMAVLLVGISVYGASLYFSYRMMKIGIESGLTPDSIFFKLIEQQSVFLGRSLLISLFIAGAIIIAFGLSMSHRIAGPIYNITSNLKNRMQHNKALPFKLRKNDFFQELEQSLNQYDEYLKSSSSKNMKS